MTFMWQNIKNMILEVGAFSKKKFHDNSKNYKNI